MSIKWYNIIKEINQGAGAPAESEDIMKAHYELEYTSNEGRYTIECFATKAAALKFMKHCNWQVLYKKVNGSTEIIADNFANIRLKQMLDDLFKIR